MKNLEQFISLKSLPPLEIGTLVLFILFIIFPIKLPVSISNIFNSSLGIVLLFITAIYLFFYTNPILGVIFILVAYEIIRRSSEVNIVNHIVNNVDNTSQENKNMDLERLNPILPPTLEEEIINKMAPARNEFIKENLHDFKPNVDSKINVSEV